MFQFDHSLLWTILTAVSASTVSLVAVAWLVRSIITYWLSKDIESFKTTMQHEKNLEIEKLRVDLNKLAAEHQIKFHQLHTKVFVTIARLYRLMVITQMAMRAYFSIFTQADGPSEAERGNAAVEAWKNLNSFFMTHEIYFEKNTCKVVREYLEQLHILVIDFQAKNFQKNYAEKWSKVWSTLNKDVENIKHNIEDSFRMKIGVES